MPYRKMWNQTTRYNYCFPDWWPSSRHMYKDSDGSEFTNGNVLKLRKALYFWNVAPWKWNETFSYFDEKHGLKRSLQNFCLYMGPAVFFTIWIDDIILCESRNDQSLQTRIHCEWFKNLTSLFSYRFHIENGTCIKQSYFQVWHG